MFIDFNSSNQFKWISLRNISIMPQCFRSFLSRKHCEGCRQRGCSFRELVSGAQRERLMVSLFSVFFVCT